MQSDNNDNSAFTRSAIRHYSRTSLNVPTLATPTFGKKVEPFLAQLSGAPKAPTQFEIEPIYKKLIYAVQEKNYGDIDFADWKLAPYVLWFGAEKLGANLDFIRRYLKWLETNGMPRDWRRLIHIYLREYGYQKTHPNSFSLQGSAIRSAIYSSNSKIRLTKWNERDARYSLFSEAPRFQSIIETFIGTSNSWMLFSEKIGLEGELGFVGFSVLVGDHLLKKLIDSPSAELIEAVKSFYMHDGNLRYPQSKAHIIEALISPWLNHKSLNEAIQHSVRDWLLKHFNDPRLPLHDRGHWQGVRFEYKKVMLRWLIGESLNQFFEIIDQVAHEGHWKYRKAFWNAYYKLDAFDEAWVVLGVEAKFYARRVFGEKISAATLAGTAKQDQSVLIVKIGDLVLADWSHDGKCRAWKVDNKFCPERYKLQYSGDALRAPSMQIVQSHMQDGISHQSSDNYLWQNRLAEFIYENTGIRVYQRDFRI